MDVTVAGLFPDPGSAEQAWKTLVQHGHMPDRISIVTRGSAEVRATVGEPEGAESHPPGDETLADAMRGGVLGGILGLAAGVLTVVLPGSLIVLGPIAGLLGGAALGATAGTVVGAFRDLGISEDEARGFMTSIEAGAVLVAVHVDERNARRPEAVLRDAGATDVHVVYPLRDD